MTDLTPEARAEREAARQSTGEFGTHERTAPDIELDEGNAYRDVTTPLTVVFRLERWNHRNEAEEVGRVEIDARAIFDSRSLASISSIDADSNDEDWVLHEAGAAGLFDGHDGPFTVELPEDFADYLAHREDNGMTEPYELAAESLEAARVEHKMTQRRDALDLAARLLVDAGDEATYMKKVSDLTPGDVLVQGAYRTSVVSALEASTFGQRLAGGGLSLYAIETEFGTLYLDEDETVRVEAF